MIKWIKKHWLVQAATVYALVALVGSVLIFTIEAAFGLHSRTIISNIGLFNAVWLALVVMHVLENYPRLAVFRAQLRFRVHTDTRRLSAIFKKIGNR